MTRVDNLINIPDESKSGTKSESTPIAQSSELLHRRECLRREMRKVELWLDNNSTEDWRIKAVISIMNDAGLRVSEVLRISPNDILDNGIIYIRGSKGSENRVISITRYRNYIINNKLSFCNYISRLSRFYIYRICRKYGFYLVNNSGKNNKVTHYFRYLYLLNLHLSSIDKRDIKNNIGHRSINSQEYYYGKIFKKV